MRHFRFAILLLLVVFAFAAGAKKPELTVRFHTEANPRDTERFARPITLKYPLRQTFIERTPALSERHILGIFPFGAPDGTYGCVFKLDADGRINLESVTTQKRGTSLVVFIGTKGGVHQVADMVVDKPVRDGIITVQSGLTELEIAALKKRFKPVLPKSTNAAGATPTPRPAP